MSRPFVFLDRDGTLTDDPGFAHRIEEYAPYPGIYSALRALRSAGFHLAIVTNQSGIGRGLFTEADYAALQAHVERDLAAHGVAIEASLYCPHAPEAGCACRKPGIALLERARDMLDADLARSWVVGDRPEDVELARRAGCAAVLVLTGHGAARRGEIPGDVPVAAGLPEAAELILRSAAPPRESRRRS